MPNYDGPRGLQPVLRGGGSDFTGVKLLYKAASYGTAVRQFDAVAAVNDGTISRSITPGTTKILGVALEAGAASTLTKHHVLIDPTTLYAIEANGSGLVAADALGTANIVLGSTSTYISDDLLNSSTIGTSGALDLKILGLHPEVDKTTGQYGVFEVVLNNAFFGQGVAGI